MRQPYTQPKKMPMKKFKWRKTKGKTQPNWIRISNDGTWMVRFMVFEESKPHTQLYELGSTYPHLKYIQEKVNSHLMLYKLNNNSFMGIYGRRRNTLEHGQYMLHILFIGSIFTFAEHDIWLLYALSIVGNAHKFSNSRYLDKRHSKSIHFSK